MKTLKKTLCLVLAVVMMLGTLAVAASATKFADDADIKYKEAVTLLNGLGVIIGDGDNFDPNGTLTREQAAKIVAYIMLGGDADELAAVSAASTKVFKDVAADRWSAGYIQYLYTEGVLAGVGDGKFDPEAPLSGAAFTKMLLCALGFDSDVEGFGTANWVQRVNAVAKEADVRVTGIAVKDAAITRDEACAIAFQALTAGKQMTYTSGNRVTINGVVVEQGKARAWTEAKNPGELLKGFGVTCVAGKVLTVNAANGGKDGETVINDVTYKVETGLDLIGHTVDVYYKTAANGDKVGVAVVDKTTVVTVAKDLEKKTAAEVKALFGLETAPTTSKLTAAAKVTNYSYNAASATDVVTVVTANKEFNVAAGTYFVVDGVIKAAKVDTYKVSAVVDYTAPTEKLDGSITITGLTAAAAEGETAAITLKDLKDTETVDKVALYDGIATGDYVYLQVCGTAPLKVTKAATVVGVVSQFNDAEVDTIVIDGKTYEISAIDDLASITNASAALITKDTKYTFILDQAGAVVGSTSYTAASSADSYALILASDYVAGEAASVSNGYKATYGKFVAYVLLADGTKTTLTYTSAEKVAVDDVKAEIGTFETGNVIKFAAKAGVLTEANVVTETTAAAAYALSAKTAKVGNDAYLSATTPIVYMDTTAETVTTKTAKVITGYAAADAAVADKAFFVTDINGAIVVVFVKAAYVGDPEETTTVAYIPAALTSGGYTSTKYDAVLEKSIYGYTVYVDGVATVLWSESATLTASAGFVNYTITDGYLTAISNSFEGLTAADGTINFIDGTIVVVDNTQLTYAGVKVITDSAANGVSATGALAKEAVIVGLQNEDGALVYAAIDAE